MGKPTSKRPKKKTIIEFTPPEPETNICPLCGNTIPDDTLRSPNILCQKCKRPIACASCKKEVLEPVGVTECPWCHSEAEGSTEKIKHAIRVRKEKEAYEKALKSSDRKNQILTRDNTEVSFVSARTDEAPKLSFNTTQVMTTDYPYRDEQDIMRRKGGWGVPFDINDDDPFIKLAAAIEDSKKRKREVAEQKQWVAEEAQRGTGRSTQRRLSAFNHLVDRVTGEPYTKRRVLFIVDTQLMVKETRRAFDILVHENYRNKYVTADVLESIDIKTVAELPSWRGKHYTLIILDLAFPLSEQDAKRLKMDISVYSAPIIGGESIVELQKMDKYGLDKSYKVETKESFNFNSDKREGQGYSHELNSGNAMLTMGKEKIPITDLTMSIDQDAKPVYTVGSRIPVNVERGPAKVEGSFSGVLGINEIGDIPGPPKVIGVAASPSNPNGTVMVRKDAGTTTMLPLQTSRKIEPGDVIYAEDVTDEYREWAKSSQPLVTTLGPDENRFQVIWALIPWKWLLFFLFIFYFVFLTLMSG